MAAKITKKSLGIEKKDIENIIEMNINTMLPLLGVVLSGMLSMSLLDFVL